MMKVYNFLFAAPLKTANFYARQRPTVDTKIVAARMLMAGAVGFAAGRALSSQRYSLIVPPAAAAVVCALSYYQAQRAMTSHRSTRDQQMRAVTAFVADPANASELKRIDYTIFEREFLMKQWDAMMRIRYSQLGPRAPHFNALISNIFNALQPTEKEAALKSFFNPPLCKVKLDDTLKKSINADNFERKFSRFLDEKELWGQPNNGLFDLGNDEILRSLWYLACASEYIPEGDNTLYKEVITAYFVKLSPQEKEQTLKNLLSGSYRNMFIYLIQHEIVKPEDCSQEIQNTFLWNQPNYGWLNLDDEKVLNFLWKAACKSEICPVEEDSLFRQVVTKFFAQEKVEKLLAVVEGSQLQMFRYLIERGIVTAADCDPVIQHKCWTSPKIASQETITLLKQCKFDIHAISKGCSVLQTVVCHNTGVQYSSEFKRVQHVAALLKEEAAYDIDVLEGACSNKEIHQRLCAYPDSFQLVDDDKWSPNLVRLIKANGKVIVDAMVRRGTHIDIQTLLLQEELFLKDDKAFEAVWDYFDKSDRSLIKLRDIIIVRDFAKEPISDYIKKLIRRAYHTISDREKLNFKIPLLRQNNKTSSLFLDPAKTGKDD
ncbi:MAG: hypothetical protein ABSA17_02455 [Rhabdochlamydiaceae bacterium]|jgi:hypothetical protein